MSSLSINESTSSQIFKFSPIVSVLKKRRYQLIVLGSALIYALVYMFAVGIISYYPGFGPLNVSSPVVRTDLDAVIIVLGHYIFIFMYYYTIVFLVISSFFVGINIALMFYSRKISKLCPCNSIGTNNNSNSISRSRNLGIASRGILGIIPSFFASFACCGGGLMALVIGPTAFSSLALYSNYMAPITIAVLGIGTFLMSRKICSQLNETIPDTVGKYVQP